MSMNEGMIMSMNEGMIMSMNEGREILLYNNIEL
jgi:hypothetical protein